MAYIPLTILCCLKGAGDGRTTSIHIESAAVDRNWYDATSDGDGGGRGVECGVQVACDMWTSQIVACDVSIQHTRRRRRVQHQCDIVWQDVGRAVRRSCRTCGERR